MATQPETQGLEIYDEIAGTPNAPQIGFTYDDIQTFDDERVRMEIIGGELIVTAMPRARHQETVARLTTELHLYARTHGGKVFPGLDVLIGSEVIIPDVLYVAHQGLSRIKDGVLHGPPDIAVEVSSPTTRRLELVRKRDLYERAATPEYLYVDLTAERLELYSLAENRYGAPAILGRGESFTSQAAPGFSVEVDSLLGEPDR